MRPIYLEKSVVWQHFGHLLSIASLVKKVQFQRHVFFGLLHQPHECKVWEEQMDSLQESLSNRKITNLNTASKKKNIYIYLDERVQQRPFITEMILGSDPITCSMNQVIPVIFYRQISSLGVWIRTKKGPPEGQHMLDVSRGARLGPEEGQPVDRPARHKAWRKSCGQNVWM